MSEGTVGKLHVEIDAKLDGLQAGLTQAQKASEQTQVKMQSSWIKAADKMNATGNKLSIGLTAPLVAAGTASVAFAVQAEQSFAKVGTIVDETVLSYEDMKKQVTDASNQTGVAVTDLNEALYESISAGVDSSKAIGFTTDMVKLAKGGFTEASKAVDVVTTVLNAYGMSADEATKVSDMLITTQNIGKTTVDELASSMGKVIPTANAYKVGLADVSTTMAVLTKNGIATAEATTYYNGMLNELGKSGSVADKALRELSGKGFQQLITDGVPVTEILQMLQTYAAGSGKSLADMFGSMEGAKAALTIMKDGGTEYNTVLKQMGDSAGATQKAFEKMDSTPMQQLQKSMNELKNASIDAGNVILPMVTNVVKSVGSLANGFSKLDPTMQKVIVGSIGIAAAAGPVLKIGAGAITTIQKIKSGIDDLKITKRTSDIVKATQATTEMAKSTVSVGTSIQTASRFTDVYGGKLTYTTAASTATAVSSTAVAGGFTSAGTASAGATAGVTAFGTALKFAFPIIGLVTVGVTTLIGVFSELSKPNEEVRKLEENTK
ncbi:MAG: phage tail tape measure protein, partial [Christensenella sp.]